MADDHVHGESVSDYFTEQLLTILVCRLLDIAAIEMYRTDRLGSSPSNSAAPFFMAGSAHRVGRSPRHRGLERGGSDHGAVCVAPDTMRIISMGRSAITRTSMRMAR